MRRALIAMVAVAGLAAVPRAHADPAAAACRLVETPVGLADGLPDTLTIRAQLCVPDGASTVHVLVPGSTLTRTWYDPAFQPERYSMVRALNAAGYATLAYDRPGTGQSSHPPSALLTVDVDVHVAHTLIQRLRSGSLGGTAFDRVIIGGLSSGAVVALAEAARHGDVDAVVAAGVLHRIDAVNLGIAASGHMPAILDPRWTRSGLDPGYIIFRPDVRANLLGANRDPAMAAYDEATQDPISLTQQLTLGPYLFSGIAGPALAPAMANFDRIAAPILLAVGQRDWGFCGQRATDCSTAGTVLAAEAPYYPNAARLDAFVLPGSGHGIDHTRNAPDWFAALIEWSDSL